LVSFGGVRLLLRRCRFDVAVECSSVVGEDGLWRERPRCERLVLGPRRGRGSARGRRGLCAAWTWWHGRIGVLESGNFGSIRSYREPGC
jgi:hypothetical protein